MTHYEIIERAIIYLTKQYPLQPSLKDTARHVGLSPFHFQRIFHEWAGVSPKKFAQYLSIQHAKQMLKQRKSLLETSAEMGISSTSRLHDLFVTIEAMTPGEYKNGGKGLSIHYCFASTRFGNTIIASTSKGICYVAFGHEEKDMFRDLVSGFPNARFSLVTEQNHRTVLKFFNMELTDGERLRLHLKGTPFQLKVWEALLRLPMGTLYTYRDVAELLDMPKSSRAVGSAIGSNAVAYIIPCHRVIRATGVLGGYRWGESRKRSLLGWEAIQASK